MIINDGFYLNGFTRQDKGEAGAVFVHYEDVPPTAPTVRSVPVEFRQTGAGKYTLMMPIELTVTQERRARVTACAVVTRTSKNCYQATAYDAKRIEYFKGASLDELRYAVAKFFEEGGIT